MLTKVFVAFHKEYQRPLDDAYVPIQVGRALAGQRLEMPGDDTGQNISTSNRTYCELTAQYWAWKNSESDAVGLAHYRRYFAGTGERGLASTEDMDSWLDQADIVIAKPRKYYIETIRSHYSRAHHASDLDVAREAVALLEPAYLGAFDRVMQQRHASLYNMSLMRRDLFEDYCSWLFGLLSECEAKIDLESYGPQQARVMGYLGERLLNVWVAKQSETLVVLTRPVVNLEGENYFKKALGLLSRRFGRGRAT